jgi:glycosyltransferase involved in cell wall biosynthesis
MAAVEVQAAGLSGTLRRRNATAERSLSKTPVVVERKLANMEGTSISIAMCTFNGGKYLNEQLQSLLKQEVQPKELVVGDDGSTDDTIDLLTKFSRIAPFPVYIVQNTHTLGFQDNFLSTASRCRGDWIAFCDQDDVWLPNKLADVHRAIPISPKDVCLYLQVSYLCDAQLGDGRQLFPNTVRQIRVGANKLPGFWVWPGFLQTFRADLVTSFAWANRPEDFDAEGRVQPHDKWICMVANALGSIEYLPKPAALYRRHELSRSGSQHGRNRHRGQRSIDIVIRHYDRLARISKQSSDCLHELSEECNNSVESNKLYRTALLFGRLSNIYRLRRELINETGRYKRIGIYLRLIREWRCGHIWLPRRGWMSVGKDLLRVFANTVL